MTETTPAEPIAAALTEAADLMTDAAATISAAAPEPERHRSAVAAYSHARRAATLDLTRAAFADAGVPIDVEQVQTEAPTQARNRRNARAALKRSLEEHVRPRDLPGVLLIEDDVIPATTLSAWLAYLERTQERPVALYAPTIDRFYPLRLNRVARGERPAARSEVATIEPATLRGWWGAQAIWLPAVWAEIVVRDVRMDAHESSLGPWDHALRRLIAERGATLGVAVPNVIQHRTERNLVTPAKRPSASASFTPDAAAPAR